MLGDLELSGVQLGLLYGLAPLGLAVGLVVARWSLPFLSLLVPLSFFLVIATSDSVYDRIPEGWQATILFGSLVAAGGIFIGVGARKLAG